MITKYRAIEGDLGRVVDALPGVVWTALTDGEIEFLSRRWSEYTGLGIDESRGRGWQAAVHPEDLPRLLAGWRSDAISSAPVEVEVRLRGPDGNYRWFLFRAHPSTDAAGKVVKWCGLATDIDERMRAGNALREDQSRAEALLAGEKRLLEMVASGRPMADTLEALCRLVESTASGSYCSIILLDPSGSKLQESIAPSIAAEFRDAVRGWPVDRLGGPCQTVARDNIQVIMPDVESDDRWRNSWRALARKHGLRSCWSTPIVSRAGDVLGTFALYWNEPGHPNALQLELIAQFTNIASIAIERAQRDAALTESEARRAEAERELQLTIDSIPTLVGTYRPDGSRIFVNQTWRDYTGLTLESAREAERNGFVHPDDAVWVTPQWRESLATGVPFQGEMRLRRADGEYRWHLVHRVPARDQSGAIAKWYSVGADIEERKRAEQALRESEARLSEAERELRVTLDTIPVIVWRGAAANGYVQQLNKRWFEYTGTTPEQVRGRRWKQCIHPDDLERHVQIGADYVAAGTPIDSEARLRRYDGEYRRFLFRPAALRDETGTITGWYGTIIDIEDRKRAEEKAVEAERELQHMIDHIPAMVATYRGDGLRLSINKRLRDYIGPVPDKDLERTIYNQRTAISDIHPDDAELAESKWRESLATGEPYQHEYRVRRYNGTYGWVMRHRVPVRDETGKVVRWYGVGYEIDDRKRAEEELRRSEALLAKAQRLSLTGSFSFNPVTEEGTWSDEVYRIYEFQPETRSTLAMIRSRYHPDDLYLLEEQIARIHSGATDLDYEHRLLMPDGSIKHVHMVAQGSRGEDGGPFEYIGAVQDITQRRAAEEELRRSEAFLAKAQRLSLTGSFSFYSATGEFTWSDELYRIFEFEPGIPVTLELIRTRYHPEDRHVMEEVTEGIRLGAADFDYEHRLLMPDGSIKHIRVVAHGAPDKERGGTEYFGAVQDVTQPRVAEQGLRRSEAYLAEAQRLSHTGSWAVDYANRKPIHSSEEHHRLFGFDPADGMPPWRAWMDRIHPEDRDRTRAIIERSSREKTDLEMDYRICLPDGTVRYVHDVGHPVLNAAGDVVEFVGTSVDVTQRRLADEALDKARSELAHVTRVMSLGALTASIAHEVNQPLSGIITNASTCLRMLAADPPNIEGARMTAQRTIRDGNRAADVITRLRALFSKKAAATETVDLNEATREVLALVFSDLLRNRVFLRTELDDDNPLLVTGDRVQLQQVILNLVRNAVDAMRDVNDRPRHLLVRAESDADGRARLVVKDAGVGLDAQAMERLFDPFYTTKDEGMGIGLSVSRSIIENHGGKLWAEANDGPGATFSFSIPRLTGNATGDRTGGEAWTPNLNGEHKAMRNS